MYPYFKIQIWDIETLYDLLQSSDQPQMVPRPRMIQTPLFSTTDV